MKPKYKSQQTFSVAKDGFFGEYYPAAGGKFKGKSLIIFGGSAGLFLLTQVLAGMFVDEGMSTMAIAYHGEEGLPKALKDQPVDVVEKAAQWLKNNGCEKVGVWGISMGGCLALLAGSLMPDLISCVVSVAPLEMVSQAEGENDKHLADGSAFSWHGRSLPYMKYVPSDPKEWSRKYHRDSWKHKELWSKDILIDSYAANDNAYQLGAFDTAFGLVCPECYERTGFVYELQNIRGVAQCSVCGKAALVVYVLAVVVALVADVLEEHCDFSYGRDAVPTSCLDHLTRLHSHTTHTSCLDHLTHCAGCGRLAASCTGVFSLAATTHGNRCRCPGRSAGITVWRFFELAIACSHPLWPLVSHRICIRCE